MFTFAPVRQWTMRRSIPVEIFFDEGHYYDSEQRQLPDALSTSIRRLAGPRAAELQFLLSITVRRVAPTRFEPSETDVYLTLLGVSVVDINDSRLMVPMHEDDQLFVHYREELTDRIQERIASDFDWQEED